MGIPVSYNLRNLFVRRLSTAVTVIGIALVVAVFVAMLALAQGFQSALAGNGLPGNAIVLRMPGNDELSSSISREWASIIATQPEVAHGPDGEPMLVSELVVVVNQPRRGGGGSSNVLTRGTSPRAMALRPGIHLAEGRMWRPGTDEVIVGRLLSQRFEGCSLGDRVGFAGRTWEVVGVFDAGGTAFESEIWGDADVMGPAFDREGFQSTTFRLADPGQFEAVKKRLEDDRRLQVVVKRESDYYAAQSEALSSVMRVLGTFISLVMAVGAVFGALNTMYAAVASRRAEIGTLMAIGFSRGSVLLSFILEALLLAAIGGGLGCLLALPLGGISAGTTNWSSFSEVAFKLRITGGILVAGMIFALVMGLVGGFFPARNASRGRIAENVRRG